MRITYAYAAAPTVVFHAFWAEQFGRLSCTPGPKALRNSVPMRFGDTPPADPTDRYFDVAIAFANDVSICDIIVKYFAFNAPLACQYIGMSNVADPVPMRTRSVPQRSTPVPLAYIQLGLCDEFTWTVASLPIFW